MTLKYWAALILALMIGLAFFAHHERAQGAALATAQAQLAEVNRANDSLKAVQARKDSTFRADSARLALRQAAADQRTAAVVGTRDSALVALAAVTDSLIPRAVVARIVAADSAVIVSQRDQIAARDSAIGLLGRQVASRDTIVAQLQRQLDAARGQLATALLSENRGFLGDLAQASGTVLKVVGAVELVKAGLGHP